MYFFFRGIRQLFIIEWLNARKKNYTFWSIIVFIISTIFLIHTVISNPDDNIWIALFWITQVFVSITATTNNVLSEKEEQLNYYYFLFNPHQFILVKIIYNTLMMVIYIIIITLFFLFFLNVPHFNIQKFVGMSVFSGLGFNLIFTFLGALTTKAKQNASFVSILSFPLLIPQLMLINKINDALLINEYNRTFYFTLALLFGLDILMFLIIIILYPFLWKD